MTQKSKDLDSIHRKDLAASNKDLFIDRIVKLNALTSVFPKEITNTDKARDESENGLKALNAEGGLQGMLAAQILSIHQLQQVSISLASQAEGLNIKQYFTNAAIKLANAFVQQADLLNKLQGHREQKIIVEHVNVHSGGQAIVGNVAPGSKEKK